MNNQMTEKIHSCTTKL